MNETTFEILEKSMNDAFENPTWMSDFTADLADVVEQGFKDKLEWTSNLKNKVKVSSTDKNRLSIIMPLYGLVIDEGRRPGAKMPPVSIIENWCKIKSIPISAAYPIARSIGVKGIKARPYIQEVLALNISQKIVEYMINTLNDNIK